MPPPRPNGILPPARPANTGLPYGGRCHHETGPNAVSVRAVCQPHPPARHPCRADSPLPPRKQRILRPDWLPRNHRRANVLTAQPGETAIDLSWTPVTGAARYELWAWTDAAGWFRLDDGNLTATTFQHTQTTPGTQYYYAVRAIAADGTASAWSNYPAATASESQISLRALVEVSVDTATPTATPTPTPTVANPDRVALVALYNATGGASWRRSTNWLSDQPLSAWYGVTLDGNGRVSELRLSTNNNSPAPSPTSAG